MGSPGAHLAEEALVAGKYRIERVLGRGGMGYVYLARHEMLDLHVALKVLSQDVVGNEEARRRLIQEARLAAKIPGDHICRVTDVGVDESGAPYIAMEYLVGQDLEALLQTRGPLPVEDAVGYVLHALEAIAHAHARGIIHRDLKPSNLFLTARDDGTPVVKVLDFGISKSTSTTQTTLTAPTAVLGSPAYMSPEQVRSAKSVDMRTDVWAIGVILFELLTAQMPFPGEAVGEVFAAILEREAPRVTTIRPDVPAELAAVIAGCLRRAIGERYTNASQVADALAPFASQADAALAAAIRNTLSRAGLLATGAASVIVSNGAEGSGSLPSMLGADAGQLAEPPTLQTAATRATTSTWSDSSRARQQAPRRRLLVAGASALAVGLLLGGAVAVSRWTSSTSASPSLAVMGSAAATAPASAAISPAPTAPATPDSASASTGDGADASTAPPPKAPSRTRSPPRATATGRPPGAAPATKPASGLSRERH
jgi:serine/threonine-protein kinase